MPLIISIDGPSSSASKEELIAREKTISLAISFAEKHSNIRTTIWDTNTGITGHAIRVMSATFREFRYVITLEEDNFLHDGIFDYFQSCFENRISNGFIATAYNSRPHNFIEGLPFITTLFPEQWVVMLSQDIFETFVRVVNTKDVSRRVIRRKFSNVLELPKLQIELLTEFWFNHFRLCARSENHGDALITYSSYVNDVPYFSPISNFVTDLGQFYDGGMNSRTAPTPEQKHELILSSFELLNYCRECDYLKSRIDSYRWKDAIGNRKYFLQLRLKNAALLD